MLPRSVCRAQLHPKSHFFATPSTPLTLPWLAPAQLRWLASQQLTAAREPSKSRSASSQNRRRRIGTVHGSDFSHNDSSFTAEEAFASGFRSQEQEPKSAWSFEKQSTPTQYVVLENKGPGETPVYRLDNLAHVDGRELLQHLYTSLKVGKLDRAQSIIGRLLMREPPDAPILSDAHAVFLQGSLDAILRLDARSKAALDAYRALQQWFDVEIRERGVVINFAMLVAMIRGAIHTMSPTERDETLRDFIEIAGSASDQLLDDVLFSDEYEDAEYDIVNDIASEFIREDELQQSVETTSALETHEAPDLAAATTKKRSTKRAVVDMSSLVEVLETQSIGLYGVKHAMDVLHELPALPADAPAEDQKHRNLIRQKKVEVAAVDIAIHRWKEADAQLRKIGIHTAMQSKPMSALMWQWYSALLPALEAERTICRALTGKRDGVDKTHKDRIHYALFLELLPLEQLAATTILYTCSKLVQEKKTNGTRDVDLKVLTLCDGLSKSLEMEAKSRSRQGRRSASIDGKTALRRRNHKLAAQRRNRLAHHAVTGRSDPYVEITTDPRTLQSWPKTVRLKLGAMLLGKLIETAQLNVTREHPRTKQRVTQSQPAFITRTKYQYGLRSGVLNPNAAFVAKLQSEPVLALLAKRMPMVVEPRPWKGYADGGYYHLPSDIMRTTTLRDGCKDHFIAADKRGDMTQIYDGLNALSKVPWRVNYDVFKVQVEAWNYGEPIANFAPLRPDFVLPPEPESSAGPDVRRKWLAEMQHLENKKRGFHANRCFQNFQLEIARSMLNETVYFPHNIDFRGRAYPIPPYLNHMGADNVRALLVFAKGKELGVTGLRWLKIHLANVAGYDKASLQDREDYTMANLDNIRASVRDPLGEGKWWLKSDDAWQTLAACHELVNALDSPDPTTFVSHLPIHQDGTCNGLQHYAALGGDKSGAAHVNLEPGDRPADVYTAVAAGVEEAVAIDAAAGNPIAQFLDGHITRKVVKQSVMTNVYGVTSYGARAQVQRQLEVLFPDVRRFDEINHLKMAAYITDKIFDSLGTMFAGAQSIQKWLETSAGRICTCLLPEQVDQLMQQYPPASNKSTGKSAKGKDMPASERQPGVRKAAAAKKESTGFKPLFKSTVVWTTPLRLPVVQPYRVTQLKQIGTALQSMTIQEPRLFDPVPRKKQQQAFPPNFIHSLDATHMLLSASKCAEIGMTFASIHDSFWTHASDISKMSTVLRDAFVTMHSEDIIGRLREEFMTRYKDSIYLADVPVTSIVAGKILQWRKQSKVKRQIDELRLEVERLRLLRSEVAEDRIKGAQMVTPGSILGAEPPEGLVKKARAATKRRNNKSRLSEDKVDPTMDGEITPENEAELQPDFELDEDFSPEGMPSKRGNVHVWLQLDFPPVPQKGDFDVTRLRQSKYFFH